jgi:hypothetical protein
MSDTLYSRVLNQIKENKEARDRGEIVNIPLPFPRLSKYLPGFQKGRYIGVTANQKVGKTKITDFLFLYNTYKFYLKNKDKMSLKIFYFCLEESKEKKMYEVMSYTLFEKFGLKVSPDELDSQFNDRPSLSQDIIEKLESLGSYFSEFQEVIEFIDDIRNPFGIYSRVRAYADQNGTYTYKTIEKKEGNTVKKEQIEDYYTPNHPNEYVFIITDHISLLTPEKSQGYEVRKAMEVFSRKYCMKMRDRWKYIVVNVHQQAQATEGVQNKKANKLQPSVDGLGENKTLGRDYDLLLGLFSPHRHEITTYEGYPINEGGRGFRDKYREFSVIANRRGPAISTDLLMLAEVNAFKELPAIGTKELTNLLLKYGV